MKKEPHVTPLKVGNVDFLVSSAIDRCPSFMMVRELTMNAIEAAAIDKSGFGKVRIKAKYFPDYPGIKKLTFWNNGPGMSSDQLSHICDIAASLKSMSLDANFGMGAKVASMSVNQLGMRYRSCKDGNVSQVVLAKVDGVYGKLQMDLDGSWEDVLDVTEKVRNEKEYSIESDWTEVVLLGNAWSQDTVSNPYGDDSVNVQW